MAFGSNSSPPGSFLQVIAGLLFAACLSWGCDESLPPRTEPAALAGAVRLNTPWVEVMGGSYQGGLLYVSVTNIYSEVLQDTADLGGSLTISAVDHPDVERTVALNPGSLINTGVLQEGMITLGPDTAALFLQPWDFHSSDGKQFWIYQRMWPSSDARGVPFMQSEEMTLQISGLVRCFKGHAAVIIPPTRVQLSFRVY